MAVIAWVSAAPASAAIDEGTYTPVTAQVPVAAGSTDGGYVSCPAGQRIVGQGALWRRPGGGLDPEAAGMSKLGSASPTIDGLGMFSSGINGAGETLNRDSGLLCLPLSVIGGPYTTVTGDSPAVTNTNTGTGGYLACPAGQRVVSGGAFWHLPGAIPDQALAADSYISSSTPTSDGLGWYADGRNLSATPRILSTVIHCVPAASFGAYTDWGPTSALVTNSTAGDSVLCPAGQRVVTGGGYWHATGAGPDASLAAARWLSSSSPTGFLPFDLGQGWFVVGRNSTPGARLTAVVLCVTPKSPATVPPTPPPVAEPATPGQGAKCKKKAKKRKKKSTKSKKKRKKCKKKANKPKKPRS